MAHRADLNALSSPQRQALVNLMLQYLTEPIIAQHPLIQHSGIHIFTGHREYIKDMEDWLQANGGGQFVPLPMWNPANTVPPEFVVVKQNAGGTRTPPQNTNADPARAMPAQFATPCGFATAALLGDAVNPWHGGVHGNVGGTFGQFNEASAVPLFWCWHAFVDHIYYNYQHCPGHGWSDIKAVPGWFGWENQGADIGLSDISGGGLLDLVVFHVDNPGGENHGYYRVGWNLDGAGNVTGGWSDIKAVPGWFGAENQGAGITLADINNSGRPDLFIFHFDHPGSEKHGYYRVGWNLDGAGNVTGGWSDIKAVPGWFGWENQGAAIALADISGNGRPDLIVFHGDNPQGENHGYYRIGWNLDDAGNVTGGWSDIKAVPDWFGAENQGAGIAVANLHGHGQRDLLIFHVDNPGGDNHGYYRVGFHLDATGNPSHGWSDIMPVSGWFGWENQGAGIAVGDIRGSGQPDLVVFHVDNPGGENHGYYRVGWDLDPLGELS
jgi:Common central domain of tyrosinase